MYKCSITCLLVPNLQKIFNEKRNRDRNIITQGIFNFFQVKSDVNRTKVLQFLDEWNILRNKRKGHSLLRGEFWEDRHHLG